MDKLAAQDLRVLEATNEPVKNNKGIMSDIYYIKYTKI